jgi:hypothetical protein
VSRPVDIEIPIDEILYRGLLSEWIDGEQVLPDAIDLEGTSVNRDKYNPDRMAVIKGPFVGVASVRICDFPAPLDRHNAPAYRFEAFDCPEPGNQAHAEIRPVRQGLGWNENHKIALGNKRLLKESLAAKMRVLALTTT